MSKNESSRVWGEDASKEIADVIISIYSVGDDKDSVNQYISTVSQYPLYPQWFEKIIKGLDKKKELVDVLEYGPGPNPFSKIIANHPKVKRYTAIEPKENYREIIREEISNLGKVINSTAEEYDAPDSADVIIATAAYHHFHDKPKAISNMHKNLRDGKELIIADVFTENYEFDENYDPVDKKDFVNKMARYAAAQIMAMPNPSSWDIEDQIKTFVLDVMRIGELKVCPNIIKTQLQNSGFKNLAITKMMGNDPKIDYGVLGYYFITAKKQF